MAGCARRRRPSGLAARSRASQHSCWISIGRWCSGPCRPTSRQCRSPPKACCSLAADSCSLICCCRSSANPGGGGAGCARSCAARWRTTAAKRSSSPRACGLGLRLEVVDLLCLHHGEPDVVEAVEQAVLAVGVDLELDHAPVWAPDLLLLKI